jgi:hypothetical protein
MLLLLLVLRKLLLLLLLLLQVQCRAKMADVCAAVAAGPADHSQLLRQQHCTHNTGTGSREAPISH